MKTILAFVLLLSASGVCLVQAQPGGADTAKSYKLCLKCQVANDPVARFCFSCGAAFEAGEVPAALPEGARTDTARTGPCPVCGTLRLPEAEYCTNCGVSFKTGLPAGGARKEEGPRKDPPMAMILSLVIPGAGQVYNSQSGKGCVQLVLYGVGWGVTLTGITSDSPSGGIGFNTPMIAGLGISVFAWGWSVVDAPLSAGAINRRRGYSALNSPGVGLAFVPDPRDPGHARPGVGLRAGF